MVKRNLMKYLNAMIGFTPAPEIAQEKYLGAYYTDSSPLLITDVELQLLRGSRRRVAFSDIKTCTLIGSKEDVRGLKVQLEGGKEIRLTGFPKRGKFDDVFAFMQFLKHAARQGCVVKRRESSTKVAASAAA